MKCPICDADLGPLDLVSRTEHVDLCIENGPSTVEVDDQGQLVIKKNIAPGKERKICPVCDKTFQNLNSHFQTCAIKHDVPPDLMLDYWERINKGVKNPKSFPRKLLDAFVTKCTKEGRLGAQVDFAKALLMSMSQDEGNTNDSSDVNITQASTLQNQEVHREEQAARDVSQVLMQKASTVGSATTKPVKATATRQRYRIELADEMTKRGNITLRINRELAATRAERYQEALREEAKLRDDKDCCVILEDDDEPEIIEAEDELNKLFNRARLKRCDGSESCLKGSCEHHDLILLMEEFEPYAGPPITSTPTKPNQFAQAPVSNEGERRTESADEETTCNRSSSSSSEPLQETQS